MAGQKKVDPEVVKEKLAKLEPELSALREELKSTADKKKRDKIIKKIAIMM